MCLEVYRGICNEIQGAGVIFGLAAGIATVIKQYSDSHNCQTTAGNIAGVWYKLEFEGTL